MSKERTFVNGKLTVKFRTEEDAKAFDNYYNSGFSIYYKGENVGTTKIRDNFNPYQFFMDDSETFTFQTYTPMFTDYENGIENENYDNEILVFCVPAIWANEWCVKEFGMSAEEFSEEYTWDDTISMFEDAKADEVVIESHVEERSF